MYRILAANQPVRERRNQRSHPCYTKPELVATGPNQTWSWDITRLRGPKRWTSFYLYVLLDIFSRCVVGWMVADRENAALAATLIEETCLKQGIEPQVLTLHSDRGAPMTSKCTAHLLADLGVTRSLSRPQVSDDNPFSEAQFKTLKYHPGFPGRFEDITAAIAFCRSFFPGTTPSTAMPGSRCSPPMMSGTGCAGSARTYPASRLGPSPRTLRPRHPETRPASRSRLDQPTRHFHNRRNESVNRNRRCLKVVDRFRAWRNSHGSRQEAQRRQAHRSHIPIPTNRNRHADRSTQSLYTCGETKHNQDPLTNRAMGDHTIAAPCTKAMPNATLPVSLGATTGAINFRQ